MQVLYLVKKEVSESQRAHIRLCCKPAADAGLLMPRFAVLDDMGHHVSGCDQVDVMGAPLLQLQHHKCELFVCDVISVSPMVDLPVLAETA